MKKVVILLFIVMVGLGSCIKNFENEFPDYDITTGYFPYQFPVRTIILGDYIYDNSNDNAHKFLISAHMGGVYKNKKDRKFSIEVDNSLCNDILSVRSGDTIAIQAMPSNYYTLSSSELIIPKDYYIGGVEVQLSEAFFDDPLAITRTYVVPVRLKSSNDVDSLLSGFSYLANPDERFTDQWEALMAPKNFTMFAVKFVNEYHGAYLHYGKCIVNDNGVKVEEATYEAMYVEQNPIVNVNTTLRRQVSANLTLRSNTLSGIISILLNFDNNDNCTIVEAPGSVRQVSGSGKFESKKWRFGNKDRDGITLNFTVTDGPITYVAEDVLVLRSRDIVMETYTPVLSSGQ